MVEFKIDQSAAAASGGPDEDPVSVARRRLSPSGAHIVLDASPDAFPSAATRVRPLAELSLWIERRRFNADPLVRGWYGPLVHDGDAVRQAYLSCSCQGCEKPVEIRHVGLGSREIAGEMVSYELTYRLFVRCSKCTDCVSSKRRELVQQTVAEMHHALDHGHRLWWVTLTYKPTRYDEAIARAKAAFEDPCPDSKQSSAARTLRERFSEGAPPDWSKLAQHEQDLLVLDVVYSDVQAYLRRVRDMEWQGDDRDGVLRTRSEPAVHRYLLAAEIAAPESRDKTLRKRGVDPASLGPGKRMIHFHIILIAVQGVMAKRTLAMCWRSFGGGNTDVKELDESDVKVKATYVAGYAFKGPLVRSEHSANWGLCVPRGTGKKAKQAIRAARLAQRQADRQDTAYLEAVRYDLEERAVRDQRATASQDALVVHADRLPAADRARARVVARRMIEHHEDTLDEPFISREVSEAAASAPPEELVDDEITGEVMQLVASQSPDGPVVRRIRKATEAARRRRRRLGASRVAIDGKPKGAGRPARDATERAPKWKNAGRQRLIVDGEDR